MSRAKRSASNVFSQFEQKQIQEYKEAFGLLDQDRDGAISIDDLREVFSSLGKVPKDAELKAMVEEAPGPLSFTMLLQLFSERLGGTDEENAIINAFKLYDNNGTGALPKDYLKDLLCSAGKPENRLTEAEFNQMLEGAPLDQKGNLDIVNFSKLIKRGKEDDE